MKRVKYIFGLIGVTLMLLSFSNCGSSKSMDSNYKLVETAPFVISEIYSQKWVAGTQQGGSGVNIQMTVESLNEGIEIKNVYFRNHIAEVHSNGANKFTSSINNTKKSDVVMDSDPVKEANNTPPKKIPFQLNDNDVVISYMKNGKMEFYKIENIVEKPMLSYPQGNPNSDH